MITGTPRRWLPFALAVPILLMATASRARDLTFEDRVLAQQAIERVYYTHQIGATRPFEEAVPRSVLERKVRQYLAWSAALDRLWQAPITGAALGGELERMARGTRMPERLIELYAALDHDPLLIQECLVRPALAGRLVRAAFARRQESGDVDRDATYDAWWSAIERDLGEHDVPVVASSTAALSYPSVRGGAVAGASGPTGVPCLPDDVWDNGGLDDAPPAANRRRAVWTGSAMIVWGGNNVPEGWRYDPTTDAWTAISTVGAPVPRDDHSAVWTGSLMIVWGGEVFSPEAWLDSGGRYDPLTDTWTPTSTVGAPSGREEHTAVWTGSRMIVWGGKGRSGLSAGGGVYDPDTDTWMPVTGAGAPSKRVKHTAVWADGEMIVWGGTSMNSTGGRYDPIADTWTPTTTFHAPLGREQHTAVWTGSRMIVWGGAGAGSTGSRYDPRTDTWAPTSNIGAPAPRSLHTAVWTGGEMIVWGGYDGAEMNSGGRYDPVADIWAPMSASDVPSQRMFHTAVWTGSLMIVWGGSQDNSALWLATGGRYDPRTDSWTPTRTVHAIPGRRDHSAVWTGNLMIVWGGRAASTLSSGGKYDPATDTWTPTSMFHAPAPRDNHSAVWTGDSMIVWGGADDSLPLDSGARYDPLADTWAATSTAGAPTPREEHVAVWTGDRMVVWGGGAFGANLGSGGRYDPVTNTWTATSMAGAPVARRGHTAVWTGDSMIVWGGHNPSQGNVASGGRYDPQANAWTATTTAGAPAPRTEHAAVWTGSRMIVWGGALQTSGGRYDPAADSWEPTSTTGAPAPRARPTAVWSGSAMIVWGGDRLDTGGRYDPVADGWAPVSLSGAPQPRDRHTAVWTGGSMIVWGGSGNTSLDTGGRYALGHALDDDGDGLSECAGDCDDANAGVLARPAEVTGLALLEDKTTLLWDSAAPAAGMATVHDVAGGWLSALPVGSGAGETCIAAGPASTAVDTTVPLAGSGLWYLIRGRNACGLGSWGAESDGTPRATNVCP